MGEGLGLWLGLEEKPRVLVVAHEPPIVVVDDAGMPTPPQPHVVLSRHRLVVRVRSNPNPTPNPAPNPTPNPTLPLPRRTTWRSSRSLSTRRGVQAGGGAEEIGLGHHLRLAPVWDLGVGAVTLLHLPDDLLTDLALLLVAEWCAAGGRSGCRGGRRCGRGRRRGYQVPLE